MNGCFCTVNQISADQFFYGFHFKTSLSDSFLSLILVIRKYSCDSRSFFRDHWYICLVNDHLCQCYTECMNIRTYAKGWLMEDSQYDEMESSLIDHGIRIIIQDLCCFFPVILMTAMLHRIHIGLLYIVLYAFLRIHCGGYHARTRSGCIALYFLMFLLYYHFRTVPVNMFSFLLLMICSVYILMNAPFMHIYNPLTLSEVHHNRTIARFLAVVYSLFYACLCFSHIEIANCLLFVISYTALLGFVQKHSQWYLPEGGIKL